MIAGAGFGGLWAARRLAGKDVEVLVVDRNNYHTFLPLLYQVAAAEIEPEAIARPVRSTLLEHDNVHFVLAEITGVDFERKILRCRERDIFYDYLVLATGSRTDFFGVEGAAEHSFELKTLEQGITLRNRIISLFERAVVEPDPALRRRMLSFTIVGGGPTGVEFAGALSELVGGIVPREYPVIGEEEVRVRLLEAADDLLPGMPLLLRRYARHRLERMGVEVLRASKVTRIAPGEVECGDGTAFHTGTVIWTAGVRAGLPRNVSGVSDAPGGRLPVDRYLQLPGKDGVYVVGDLAWTGDSVGELPMMAPVATSQGETAAGNILLEIEGRPRKIYRYNDRGSMVTIGRNNAVAHIFGRSFTGWPAWVIWLGVHLFNLIGFRNRLMVLLGWSWDYFFFERTVKLILPVESEEQGAGGRAQARAGGGRWVHCRQQSLRGYHWPHHVRRVDR